MKIILMGNKETVLNWRLLEKGRDRRAVKEVLLQNVGLKNLFEDRI